MQAAIIELSAGRWAITTISDHKFSAFHFVTEANKRAYCSGGIVKWPVNELMTLIELKLAVSSSKSELSYF